MADGTRTYSFVLDGTGILEGKNQLSAVLGQSWLSASSSRYCSSKKRVEPVMLGRRAVSLQAVQLVYEHMEIVCASSWV